MDKKLMVTGLSLIMAGTFGNQQAEEFEPDYVVTWVYEDGCVDLQDVETLEYKFYCESDFQ